MKPIPLSRSSATNASAPGTRCSSRTRTPSMSIRKFHGVSLLTSRLSPESRVETTPAHRKGRSTQPVRAGWTAEPAAGDRGLGGASEGSGGGAGLLGGVGEAALDDLAAAGRLALRTGPLAGDAGAVGEGPVHGDAHLLDPPLGPGGERP